MKNIFFLTYDIIYNYIYTTHSNVSTTYRWTTQEKS